MRPVYDTGLSEALIAAGGTALLAAADSITAHGYPPGLLLIPDGWQDNSGEGASTATSMPLSAIRRMNLPGADST